MTKSTATSAFFGIFRKSNQNARSICLWRGISGSLIFSYNTARYREAMTLEIGIASWNAPPEKVLIYAGFRGFENEKIFEFSPSVLPIFQSGLGEDTTWRVVRVVEGATLEKSCAARHLGFESLTLRQPEKPVLPASLFYSRFPIPKPASIASAEITFELYSRCA